MNKNFIKWQISGFLFTSVMGTVLHFLYEWTEKNTIAALFSGVNESTWEHMKLLFVPMLAFALIESRFFKEMQSFWWVKLIGATVGLLAIPVIFYTYNGAIGKSPDWFNITIFFISAAITYLTECYIVKKTDIRFKHTKIAIFLLLFIFILFVIFTFKTPRLPLFQDPVTGQYGK